ncbi:MAG TPA: TPM domain-containing protein [Lacunisphaera sp.]|nr:TPM domain-containing protein [Lacunisphaera sp.]
MRLPFALFQRAVLWSLVFVPAAGSFAGLPPKPATGELLHDYAAVIPESTQQEIREIQTQVLREQGTPLVVVTVSNFGRYDTGARNVEAYARDWFNGWGIGSARQNTGILVLVVVDERKARIELGSDWGRRWDDYADRVMQLKMVPKFRNRDYAGGIRAAVESLARMAVLGPKAEPPAGSALDRFLMCQAAQYLVHDNPLKSFFGPKVALPFVIAAAVAFLMAVLHPHRRKYYVAIGCGLLGILVLFWIVVGLAVLAVALFAHDQDGDGTSSEGGDSSDSGGSSGGGGASGEW